MELKPQIIRQIQHNLTLECQRLAAEIAYDYNMDGPYKEALRIHAQDIKLDITGDERDRLVLVEVTTANYLSSLSAKERIGVPRGLPRTTLYELIAAMLPTLMAGCASLVAEMDETKLQKLVDNHKADLYMRLVKWDGAPRYQPKGSDEGCTKFEIKSFLLRPSDDTSLDAWKMAYCQAANEALDDTADYDYVGSPYLRYDEGRLTLTVSVASRSAQPSDI